MYKPTKDDILFAEKVYNDVIVTQVLNPNLIVEAYRKLTGVDTPLVNKMQARRFVFNFFYYKRHLELLDELFDVDSEDKQEDVNTLLAQNFTIGTMENKDKQSHSEDVNDDIAFTPKSRGIRKTMQELEEMYDEATDANVKRSIKYKMNQLKKENG
jgi:hypothetical protein